VGRSSSRSDVPQAEAPRRSLSRQVSMDEGDEGDEGETAPMPAARLSRGAMPAADVRARYDEDPDADPERTRLPPVQSDEDAQDTLPIPVRRRTTGHVSRVQAEAPAPAPAPRKRTTSRMDARAAPPPKPARDDDDEPSAPMRQEAAPRLRAPQLSGEVLKKVIMGVGALAVVLLLVKYGHLLFIAPIDGMGVFVSVDTNPKVMVKVKHSDKCGSKEPFTELGMTPLKAVAGAHIQDTLILENQEQGIYAEEEEALRFGEPNETKVVKREFRMGHVRLKIIPKSAGSLRILKDGRELGPYLPGSKLELMEGTHTLELRGDKLTEPVQVEVNIKGRDLTETVVDVSKNL
jgi:hypothetical protein